VLQRYVANNCFHYRGPAGRAAPNPQRDSCDRKYFAEAIERDLRTSGNRILNLAVDRLLGASHVGQDDKICLLLDEGDLTPCLSPDSGRPACVACVTTGFEE
jgi:hypothetical protein